MSVTLVCCLDDYFYDYGLLLVCASFVVLFGVLSVVYFIFCDARYTIGVASPENLLKEIYLRRTVFYYIDQEGEVHGHIADPGKLPSILQLCYYFPIHFIHNGFFAKKIKTFSPMCEKIFCHPILSS